MEKSDEDHKITSTIVLSQTFDNAFSERIDLFSYISAHIYELNKAICHESYIQLYSYQPVNIYQSSPIFFIGKNVATLNNQMVYPLETAGNLQREILRY